jgi:hypothetical protein
MKSILKASVLGVIFLVPLVGSSALPVSNAGGARCNCYCRSSNGFKELDWLKDKACGLSDGKSCTYTEGGKTKSGTLGSCQECRAGDTGTEWICKNSWLQSRAPAGTLQRVTPAPRPRTTTTPPPMQATPH